MLSWFYWERGHLEPGFIWEGKFRGQVSLGKRGFLWLVLFGKGGFGIWKLELDAPGSSFPSLDPALGSPILSFLQGNLG